MKNLTTLFNSWLFKNVKTNTIRLQTLSIIYTTKEGMKYQHNPFKLNGISVSYQLDQSVFILRVIRWYFTSLFKS